MKIEINEKGSKEFYTEIVNVVSQFRKLLKKPDGKLVDFFRIYRLYVILCGAFLLIIGAMWLAWGGDGFMPVAAALLAVALLFSAVFLVSLSKSRKTLLDDKRGSVLTLDENGVQLEKIGGSKIQFQWDNVAFVRVYKESLCIHAREGLGFVIAIDRKYEGQILDWLHENQPSIRVIR